MKYFADPEAAILLLALIVGLTVILVFGKLMGPLLVAMVLAYLLDALVMPLQRGLKLPRTVAVIIVYCLFVGCLVVGVVGLLPLLSKQFSQMMTELPEIVTSLHAYLLQLPQKYPTFIPQRTVQDLVASTNLSSDKIADWAQSFFSFSLASLANIVGWLVYLFLVPLLTLFFLKDKDSLMNWFGGYVPQERGLMLEVWQEMKRQLGRYVRGKVLELIIVSIATYIGFRAFNLNYASLLAILVGVSVILPYIGVVIVSIPVAMVGLLQWGPSAEFTYMMIVYLVIQVLDGNLLVPLLFSEAVNLHPIAIVAAVLFFGGIWGFWGLFFAIPLATLVKAVIYAWRRHAQKKEAIARSILPRKSRQ